MATPALHQLIEAFFEYDEGNYVEARRLFGVAAARGDAEAQTRLARMLREGEGGPMDEVEARRLREQVSSLQGAVLARPGDDAAALAPPPLILSEATAAKVRPSLAELLGLGGGDGEGARLLLPGGESADGAALAGAEVVGLYLSASWCPPCRAQSQALRLACMLMPCQASQNFKRKLGYRRLCSRAYDNQLSFHLRCDR